MPATAATTGYSTLLKRGATAVVEVKKLTAVGPNRETVECTNLSSPSETKEFIMGLIDSREFGAEINYLPQNATHKQLLTDFNAKTLSTWSVVLPDGSSTWSVSAYVADFSLPIEPGAAMVATVKFRTSGPWTFPA
jgi:predicted secreted protein